LSFVKRTNKEAGIVTLLVDDVIQQFGTDIGFIKTTMELSRAQGRWHSVCQSGREHQFQKTLEFPDCSLREHGKILTLLDPAGLLAIEPLDDR
jgi:hypothetical protein